MKKLIYIVIGLVTAIVANHLYNSIFIAIICWLFWPITWLKWVICQEISRSIIENALAPFLQ